MKGNLRKNIRIKNRKNYLKTNLWNNFSCEFSRSIRKKICSRIFGSKLTNNISAFQLFSAFQLLRKHYLKKKSVKQFFFFILSRIFFFFFLFGYMGPYSQMRFSLKYFEYSFADFFSNILWKFFFQYSFAVYILKILARIFFQKFLHLLSNNFMQDH